MLDLDAVNALVAVARTGTVHGAAAALGYTPSAISQQVKRLERDLGAVLLDREGRRVVLTAAGRRVVDEGTRLREQVEALRAGVQHADGRPTGTLHVAAFATAMRGVVPELARRVTNDAPGLRLTVSEIDPWEAVEAVAAGGVDVAIVHHWEGVALSLPPSVRSEQLFRDEADVLVHRDDPLAVRESVTPDDLRSRTWACTPDGTICFEWFCLMFRGDGAVPRIDYRCGEFASQVALVAAGVAVALVPRLGRGVLPPEVVAVPVHQPTPTRPVDVVWRASMTQSPAIAYVRTALREGFSSSVMNTDRGSGA